jgi:hypothetical protein
VDVEEQLECAGCLLLKLTLNEDTHQWTQRTRRAAVREGNRNEGCCVCMTSCVTCVCNHGCTQTHTHTHTHAHAHVRTIYAQNGRKERWMCF